MESILCLAHLRVGRGARVRYKTAVKVVLDARWIFPQLSGIGAYTRELIRHLPAADGDTTYVLLFDSALLADRVRRDAGLDALPNALIERVPYGLFSAASQLRLPGLLRRLRTGVYHAPNYLVPYAAFGKRPRRRGPACVITLHDLIPLLFPHYTPKALKTRLLPLFRLVLRASARRADAIITPSACSRRDVIRALRLPAGRAPAVTVVPEGVHERFRPPPARPPAREILFVGRFDPYKNAPRLVEAFADLRRRVPDARLRLVGPPDARYPGARAAAERLGVSGAVRWDGYLADEDLVRAYGEAAVFALPSRYEGFGLPVLEAMACGTPVVCGNRSSLPEVAGDAALLVDPDDTAALAGALERVLTEPALAAHLAAKGLRQAARFSWRRTAEQTLEVYRSVARDA